MGSVGLFDIVTWLVYVILAGLVLFIYRSSKDAPLYKYFMSGFALKVAGSLMFALIFIYYYGFGDSFLYHRGASVLADVMVESPVDYIRLLFSESGNLPMDLKQFESSISYSRTFEEWFMVKLLSPFALLSFKSYLVLNFFMSLLAFWGGWKLFRVFDDIFPEKRRWNFVMVFLLPSLVFWGSGVMKDTVTLWGVNYIIYYIYFMLKGKNSLGKLIQFWIGLIFCGYIVFGLKSYILIALIPGILMFFYYHFKSGIDSTLIRIIISPIILAIMITIGVVGVFNLSEQSEKYSQDQLKYKVKGFHSWHTDVGGSSYSLGEDNFTPIGIASKIPAALNVTFFRPYLWESGSIVVLIGALESLFFLVLFVRMLILLFMSGFRIENSSPLLWGMLAFVLIFGFAVGYTSYNFGGLARYKMPVMSLFGVWMIFVSYQASRYRKEKISENYAESDTASS